MNFNQVKPLKGYEMVMNRIRDSIESGELKPGDKLSSVVDLATSFGVGRSTIREALSALKAMGWVDILQGGGTYVAEQLPKDGETPDLFDRAESLKEILEIRKIMETGGVRLAAQNRTDEDLQVLRDILEEMEDSIDDEVRGEEADAKFHLQLAKATHNGLILHMMELLSQRLQESMMESRRLWFYAEKASSQRLLQEHRKIYEAIFDRNEGKAYDTMMQHLLKVESVLHHRGNNL
ncbi:FadR/GntR family transcriptional regulator [Paenibacillus eucommiae]|uniref:GntR family transcriptional repressor for pyruvate dehydrogenase complex n=1 Tax=Paenibacillus eucommiae TaxID=1355755 RepID=A0ABS4IN22_9BACL|nr:FadR/GntR family transcriptional regulator [Paenibacillus eucommiae]MBP1988939.1 GntR family transcriptional repressor for pyruvate dehydrogenase complex [Paenibacillus eucommiae]